MVAFLTEPSETLRADTREPTKRCDIGLTVTIRTLGARISRDPIGELGGRNLYVFTLNNAIGLYDRFGLDVYSCITGCKRTMIIDMASAAGYAAAQHLPDLGVGIITSLGSIYLTLQAPALGLLVDAIVAAYDYYVLNQLLTDLTNRRNDIALNYTGCLVDCQTLYPCDKDVVRDFWHNNPAYQIELR